MSTLAPPPAPPRIGSGGEDERRYRMRLTQVTATLTTLFATAWVCTWGAIPAIIALAVAKHVLVAVLVMGIGVDAPASLIDRMRSTFSPAAAA